MRAWIDRCLDPELVQQQEQQFQPQFGQRDKGGMIARGGTSGGSDVSIAKIRGDHGDGDRVADGIGDDDMHRGDVESLLKTLPDTVRSFAFM